MTVTLSTPESNQDTVFVRFLLMIKLSTYAKPVQQFEKLFTTVKLSSEDRYRLMYKHVEWG